MASDHDHDHDHGPKDAGTEAWHRMLHHTGHDQLSEDTAQTPGMRRYEAISGTRNGSRKLWMGKNHVGPGMVSADHHHGEAETGIYIVSGHPVFVFLEDGEERRVETGPGDYIYVPPYVPHREENPSPDEEAVVVLARSTQDGHRRQPPEPARRGARARRADRAARRRAGLTGRARQGGAPPGYHQPSLSSIVTSVRRRVCSSRAARANAMTSSPRPCASAALRIARRWRMALP